MTHPVADSQHARVQGLHKPSGVVTLVLYVCNAFCIVTLALTAAAGGVILCRAHCV